MVAITLTAITIDAARPPNTALLWYLAAFSVVAATLASLYLRFLAQRAAVVATESRALHWEPAMFGALSDSVFAAKSPRSEAIVAGAGLAVSTLVALLFGGLWLVGPDPSLVHGTVGALALIHGSLLLAQLVPCYPLDAGRLLHAFGWYLSDNLVMTTRIVQLATSVLHGLWLAIGLVLLAVGDVSSTWGAWVLLAFWGIAIAGREGLDRIIWRETSRDLTLDDLGMGNSRRVNADTPIDTALDDMLEHLSEGPMLVRDGTDVIGIVTLDGLRHIPRRQWSSRTVRELCQPVADSPILQYDSSVTELVDLLDVNDQPVVLVETRGIITGALERQSAIRTARSRIRSVRARQRSRQAR